MDIKVLLINSDAPDFLYDTNEYYIPSGMLYLASMLKHNNINMKVLDLNVVRYRYNKEPDAELLNVIEEYKPNLIGIGCLFSGTFPAVSRYASLIKSKFNDIKIVIGGMHPTLFNKEIKENCDDIDYIISGEGEIALLKLIKYIFGEISIDEVPALTYKLNGQVVVNEFREQINDLSNLSPICHDIFNLQDYHNKQTEFWHNPKKLDIRISLPILTSRGCPFKCNFCCMHNMMSRKIRYRPYLDVVNEIQNLYDKYGYNRFSFMDDNLTFSKKYVISMSNEIVKRGMNIQYETPNGLHMNTLDKDVFDAMYESGMVRTAFAIESGDEYIRNKIMGKHVKTEKIYEVVELAKTYKDLFTIAFFLIDMPEDTNESLSNTYEMVKRLNVDKFYIGNVTPFPGTDLFNQCVRDSLFTKKMDLTNIWKIPFDWKEHRKNLSTEQFFIQPYNMSLEDLLEWRKKFYLFDLHAQGKNGEEYEFNGK